MSVSQKVLQYGVAILASAIAVAVSAVLRPVLGYGPAVPFGAAVAISAWFGGFGPGLLATGLCALSYDWFLTGPQFRLTLAFPVPLVPVVEILVVGVLVAWVTANLRTTRERAATNLAVLDTLLSSAPIGMAYLDRQLRYVRINQTMAAINGIPARDHVGRTVEDVIPRMAPRIVPMLCHVLETGQPVVNQEMTGETPLRPGRRGYWLTSGYPVRTASGRIIGIGAILVDITPLRQAEEAQRHLASRLQLLLESTGEGIYGIDSVGLCTFINRAGARTLGYEQDELLGKRMHDLIHYRRPDGTPYPVTECPIYRVLKTGQGVRVDDEVLWRRDGTPLPVLYSSFPIVEDGRTVGAVVAFADITARKQAEKTRIELAREQAVRGAVELERARLQTILDNAPTAIIFVDARTGQVLSNPVTSEMMGRHLTPEGGTAQYVGQILDTSGRVVPLDELPSSRALRGESVLDQDYVVAQTGGRQIPVRLSAAPVRDNTGQILGAVVVAQDISALKELERLREEWTSIIAHDLRQPVTVISGYADLLARQADNYPAPMKTRIEHIVTSTNQLKRMIADLLDVSRIEARRLQLERRTVDLVALVREVIERAVQVAEDHPIRVSAVDSLPCEGVDPGRIEQVLVNLISNAAKYGYAGSEILVEIRQNGHAAEVSVTNRGPGIPPEELTRLFTRFYRARSGRPEQVAGLGLGLYITKGLVEAHGGRIWVESVPGQTTTFRFTLPCSGSNSC